jgi:hypothetical protein
LAGNDPLAKKYEEQMGKKPPNLPEDHPDRWQWEYVGKSADDKERLRSLIDETEEPDAPAQEETLF